MYASPETNERYWAHYDGLQHAKHFILRRYLDGWFPILSSLSGRVLYIDCHAGRGRHKTGHEGSPILALRRLLEHKLRNRILASTEVRFMFFEINPDHYPALKSEIAALGNLPQQIHVDVYCEDYEPALQEAFEDLKRRGQVLAPAFAFVDPYGFSLSMDLLNKLLSFRRCELLVNFMYRYVDMAIHRDEQTSNMDSLFGCPDWRSLATIDDPSDRAEATIRLFSSQLRAEFVTHMYMRGVNKRLKYVLLHATNHKRGRELMKEAMWSIEPSGSFAAYERTNPNQLILISADPELRPLKDRLWSEFVGREARMDVIYDWLAGELYLKKHLHQVLRDYRSRGILEFSGYTGRFGFNRNPIVHFPAERPQGA